MQELTFPLIELVAGGRPLFDSEVPPPKRFWPVPPYRPTFGDDV